MKPRILVIEDERAIRDGLCDVLAFNGYAPTGAADGSEGLAVALEGEWELLLVDVLLPGVENCSTWTERLFAGAISCPLGIPRFCSRVAGAAEEAAPADDASR